MVSRVFYLVTAFLVASLTLAYAQTSPQLPTQTDVNVLTDARIGILKAALQLTLEQAQYWPAIEEAIRARAQSQYQRITAAAERLGQGREVDPIELLRSRADALAERAANLKKLVDAWQPLYQSLRPEQKQRLRLLAARILPQLRDAVLTTRMEMYDEDSDAN
jgi:hypothetical protein